VIECGSGACDRCCVTGSWKPFVAFLGRVEASSGTLVSKHVFVALLHRLRICRREGKGSVTGERGKEVAGLCKQALAAE
jgi:hypothetical protein